MMNLKDCVWLSDSLVIPHQVKTRSGGYLGHGREGIGVKELWLRPSEVKSEHGCRTRTPTGGATPPPPEELLFVT